MKGYTIQHSIELLEKNQGGGSGGPTSADQVSFNKTGTGLDATNVQGALSELDADNTTISTKIDTALTFPTDSTPIVVGKYGDRDILRRYLNPTSLATGSNTIDFPVFDKLINICGCVRSADASPKVEAINSNNRVSDAWYNELHVITGDSTASFYVGSSFNGGSAEIWVDYVAPTPTRSKKK